MSESVKKAEIDHGKTKLEFPKKQLGTKTTVGGKVKGQIAAARAE